MQEEQKGNVGNPLPISISSAEIQKLTSEIQELNAYIPITPQDAIFNEPLAAHLKRSSIGKTRNTTSIASRFSSIRTF